MNNGALYSRAVFAEESLSLRRASPLPNKLPEWFVLPGCVETLCTREALALREAAGGVCAAVCESWRRTRPWNGDLEFK